MTMKEETLYTKNLALFARSNPVEAYRLDWADCSGMEFCTTMQGELNLRERGCIDLYAPEGALLEANTWAKIVPLDKIDALFVYGIGLGYYYLALERWLEEDPKRRLVFIEDDPRVVRFFLHTQLATSILNHPQVMVQLYPFLRKGGDVWGALRVHGAPILWPFAGTPKVHVSALQAYFAMRFPFFHQFVGQWYMNLSHARRRLSEYLPNPHPALVNYYSNLPYAAEAVPAEEMYGQFSSFPAILCGAGPSLDKQLPILWKLQDKALIMAPGSAINALTRAQIMPHVAGVIDPKHSQISRQLTSFAYNVPAFYQNRYYSRALEQWHGPRLYVEGSGNFRIAEWFQNHLKTSKGPEVIMGVSASNFLTETAGHLGCKVILMVGMDLAYTEGTHYSSGVVAHPADDRIEHEAITEKSSRSFPVPGITETDVLSQQVWMLEAVCMAGFKLRNPDTVFLNATEGGMAIPSIPTSAFQEAVDKYAAEQLDVQGWVHGTIQNASVKAPSSHAILQAMEEWKNSLGNCLDYLQRLKKDLECNRQKLKSGKLLPYGPYSGRASLWEVELDSQPAYQYLLQTLEVVFDTAHLLRQQGIDRIPTKKKRDAKKIAYAIEKCAFLASHAASHIQAIDQSFQNYRHRKAIMEQPFAQAERLEGTIQIPDYRHNKELIIDDKKAFFDPELIPKTMHPQSGQQTSFEAIVGRLKGKRHGQALHFYPSGKVKAEAFYANGHLHGPSSFYSEEGMLLARNWFINGKREGISLFLYADGNVYSILTYHDGQPEGQHDYYYSDGLLKTRENYVDGVLDGAVQLFYSNGRSKKEQHFLQGKLHGRERMWNEEGVLMLEAFYEQGRPIGLSRMWDEEGRLIREVKAE
jgi:antitoxin component YwqK of YwqJK toxin-antitoxin module